MKGGSDSHPAETSATVGYDKYELFGAYHWRHYPTGVLRQIWRWDPYKRAHHRIMLRLLRARLGAAPIEGSILEVGCGDGVVTHLLTSLGYTVVGLDLERRALHLGRAEFAKRGRRSPVVVQGTCAALPFRDAEFSAVLCTEIVEHLDEATSDAFFAEAYRVAKPGGLLVVTTPQKQTDEMKSPYHVHEFSAADLERAIGRYFTDVEVYGYLANRTLAWYRPPGRHKVAVAAGIGLRLMWKVLGHVYNPFVAVTPRPTKEHEHVLAIGRKAS